MTRHHVGESNEHFPSGTDAETLNFLVPQFLPNDILGIVCSGAPDVPGIADLDFPVIDPDIYRIFRPSPYDQVVEAGPSQLRGKEPAHIRGPHASRQRGLPHHVGSR